MHMNFSYIRKNTTRYLTTNHESVEVIMPNSCEPRQEKVRVLRSVDIQESLNIFGHVVRATQSFETRNFVWIPGSICFQVRCYYEGSQVIVRGLSHCLSKTFT